MSTMREPTDRELLYDIRQLLYKLIYGNEAEGIKSICKGGNPLEKRIENLESQVTQLQAEINVMRTINTHQIYPAITTHPFIMGNGYDPNQTQVICSYDNQPTDKIVSGSQKIKKVK